MPSPNWSDSFEASYRYVRVSRASGKEVGEVPNVLNGGTITRNQDTENFESGSVDFVGDLDLGVDLLRVYLDATFTDGTTVSECLGTFLPSVPKRTGEGRYWKGTATLYGRLKELSDDDFDKVTSVPAGTGAVAFARKICEEAGLSVVADASDYRLTAAWTFGLGGKDDSADSKLEAVNDLLEVAGFSAAQTDPMGRVVMRKYVDVAQRPVAWEFVEGANARFLREVTEELDKGGVANVVHVDYSTQDMSIRGTAIDSDPKSPWSTVSVGRRIVKRYSYSDMPDGTTSAQAQKLADQRARELLIGQQSVAHKITFEHVYCPISPGDGIAFRYPSANMAMRPAVRTQKLTLGTGCMIQCEARLFER